MTRLEALKALEAGVASGKLPSNPLIRAAFPDVELGVRDDGADVVRAYHGSLDAAMALHEAVVPEWVYALRGPIEGKEPMPLRMILVPPREPITDDDCVTATALTPARAWLIAILRALIAEEEA